MGVRSPFQYWFNSWYPLRPSRRRSQNRPFSTLIVFFIGVLTHSWCRLQVYLVSVIASAIDHLQSQLWVCLACSPVIGVDRGNGCRLLSCWCCLWKFTESAIFPLPLTSWLGWYLYLFFPSSRWVGLVGPILLMSWLFRIRYAFRRILASCLIEYLSLSKLL